MNSFQKSLPARPNLEFHKKQAKSRVKAGEFGTHSAALYAIAKEHGFSSWPVMKGFIELRLLDVSERLARVVRAACSNDVRQALALLSVEPELGRSDVYAACALGEFEYVEKWLRQNASRVNDNGGPNNWPPLLYACHSRVLRVDRDRSAGIERVVELLLDGGADPNAHFMASDHPDLPQTALYGAAGIANNPRITLALLKKGADPNGAESLYHACEFEDITCLRLLLEAKPKPDWVSYCFRRMLDLPNEAGALLFLEQGADPSLKLREGLRPQLHQAIVMLRSLRTIEAMLDHGAHPDTEFEGMNSYRLAIRFGREDVARLLAQRGANTTTVTEEDRGLGACFQGQPHSGLAGDINAIDVLELAAAKGQLHSVEALLGLGPSVDTVMNRTKALQAACWSGRGPVARFILECGVDFSELNQYGGNLLQATQHGSQFCQDPDGGMGTKLPEEAHPGDYAEIVRLLLDKGFPVPARADFGSLAVRDVLREFGAEDPE